MQSEGGGGDTRARLWLSDAGGRVALATVVLAFGLTLYNRMTGTLAGYLDAWLGIVMIAAAWTAWRTAGHFDIQRARRTGWRLAAVAVVVAACGLILSRALGLAGMVDEATAAAGLRIGFYPLLALAAVCFIRSASHRSRWLKIGLDGGVVALSFGSLLWFVVLKPTIRGLADGSLAGSAGLVYTLLDAGLLLLLTVALAIRPPRDDSPSGAWLAAAAALLLASDFWQLGLPGAPATPDLLPAMLLQLAAYALVAVAAQADHVAASLLPDALRRPADGAPGVGLLPLAGLFLAMGSLVYFQAGAWSQASGALALVVCLAGVMVLVRQQRATRDVAGQEAERARREAEERFTSLVRNSSDVIAIAGDAGRLFYATPSAERIFGIRPEDLVGRTFDDFFAAEDQPKVREFLARTLAAPGSNGTLELRVPRGHDRHRVVEIVGTNLSNEPTVAGQVLNIRDVTDRRALEDQLKRLAFHDPLTLLANRALFRDRVEHALQLSRRRGSRIAAIFVDLDNFKKINDSLGHGEGDRVLRASAQRLTKCTRASDTVARLGGDEFAVLVEDATETQPVVDAAARIVEALQEPFAFAGSSLKVAASVGVAFAEPDDSVEEVLRNADVAMYNAKANGKNRFSVFQPQMQKAIRDRLRIEADLTRALNKSELRLLFQPIVDLESGYLLGVEALVRWQHPTRGLITPSEFIGVAEETGQVIGLGRWVLNQACSAVHRWQRRMPRGRQLRVAVNVSGQQLQGADLISEVTGALQHSGLDPGCLVVEMTESVVMTDTEATFAKLQRLKRLGVRIAIDDFGTGYSSLSYLHRFPIDILKIDRSFIERIGAEKDGAELVRAIITLGETLGLEVVAEGIELEHQVRQLLELGCVAGQGFYYSKPALLEEIEYSHQARLREAVVQELPPEADVSATGRFRLPSFALSGDDLDMTGTFSR